MSALPVTIERPAAAGNAPQLGRWRRLPIKAKVGAVLLGIFVLAAIIGPLVTPYDPSFQNPSPACRCTRRRRAPARHHPERPGRALPAAGRHPADA